MTSPSWLPPDVVAAIESGRRIEAVKLLRESRGLGLAEAKEAVDAYARSLGTPEAAPAPDGSLPPEALQALRNGNKIEAIRLVREQRGLSLRDAKLLVESLEANEPVPSGSLSAAPPQKSRKWGGLLWVLILLLVAGYLVYRLLGNAQ